VGVGVGVGTGTGAFERRNPMPTKANIG
jgi:hypothetical protein